jgi:hypothetical protein
MMPALCDERDIDLVEVAIDKIAGLGDVVTPEQARQLAEALRHAAGVLQAHADRQPPKRPST